MLTDDDILQQSIKAADENIYVSDSIKNAVFKNKNDSDFRVSITASVNVYDFKIISYTKNKNTTISFNSKNIFIKDLICDNIKSLAVYLENVKINTFDSINNNIQYKISLFKDNIYNIELEISEDKNERQ